MDKQTEPAWQTGLYIHIPFCEKKCPYCDFNTYAGLDSLFDDTVEALCLELINWSEVLSQRSLHSIFLGGGTPSALSVDQLGRIFDTVHQYYTLTADCEVTSEVNPGAVDQTKFAALHSMGVNRLSMGVQSFQESELRFLGRIHGVEDVYQAYHSARDAGFDNVNLDFIFGLPEQQDAQWRDTLQQALTLSPDHLSLYSLIVEPNTVLKHWVDTGMTPSPDDDAAARQYESAIELLADAGYFHYEVSNWCRQPELVCKHNLIYWRNYDYLGVGPGAHSHLRIRQAEFTETTPAPVVQSSASSIGKTSQVSRGLNNSGLHATGSVVHGQANPQLLHMLPTRVDEDWIELRWGNRKPVPGHIKRVRSIQPTSEFVEKPSASVAMGETMMLGLRLIHEGVPFHHFMQLHQADLREVYAEEISELLALGYVQLDEERIQLTPSGLMVGNQVFYRFL